MYLGCDCPVNFMPKVLFSIIALFFAHALSAQWLLDEDWSGDGRKAEESDRWEVPMAIDAQGPEVIMITAAYDADGAVVPRWRGFSSWGGLIWEGEGDEGERPIDATFATWQDHWFMLTEVPDADGDTLAGALRVRAFDAGTPIEDWGNAGVVDMTFVGPMQEGGSIHAQSVESGAPQALWNWLLISGAAFDSCCAHQELPALAVLNAFDGGYHPEFGEEGRIVLDPDGWQVEDSVRHEFSGRFEAALFVPWDMQMTDPYDLENIRILAGGTYALTGAFRPFLAMFRWDGSLETEFGDGGIMTWFEDAGLNHGVVDLRHRWEWLGPDYGVQIQIGVPAGEPVLAAGTMSVGLLELWPGSESMTDGIEPGLITQSPVRSVGLAAGFGWKLEDETVVVGSLEEGMAWDAPAHPVWWTGPNTSFGGTGAFWTEDVEYPSQRAGAAFSRGGKLYIGSTLPGENPASGSWLLSRWREDASSVDRLSIMDDLPHPNPTNGPIEWTVPEGTIECRDAQGRLIQRWIHPGGVFRAVLPKGGAWMGCEGCGWHPVRRVD